MSGPFLSRFSAKAVRKWTWTLGVQNPRRFAKYPFDNVTYGKILIVPWLQAVELHPWQYKYIFGCSMVYGMCVEEHRGWDILPKFNHYSLDSYIAFGRGLFSGHKFMANYRSDSPSGRSTASNNIFEDDSSVLGGGLTVRLTLVIASSYMYFLF